MDCATDSPDPVDEPADVFADSARSEPDIDDVPAGEPVSAAVFLDDDRDSVTESVDSSEFTGLEPPVDDPMPAEVLLVDGDRDSVTESADLFCESACFEPPADETFVDVSVVALFGVDPLLPDCEADEVDLPESVPESSAHATPGVVATAVPTPSATANAPTRPTYLAYLIVVSPSKAPN